jgi:hypothetical protein
MIGVGDALGTAVQLALLTLLLGMVAAFMWAFMFDPFKLRSTWRIALVACAAAILVAATDVLIIRLIARSLYPLLAVNGTATLLALFDLLKRVLRDQL